MTSKREYRVHCVSDSTGHDSRSIGVDDHNLSGTPILSEFSRTAKAVKQISVNPANVHDVTLCLNFPDQSENVYTALGCPFKQFNKLLLFPFHGFW
ncbi:MAG: hypothetical protein V4560_08220 [Bacteroidota bacterium]